MDFAVPVDYKVKIKESETRDKYLDHAWELNKTMEHDSDGVIGALGTVTKGFMQSLEDLEIRG